MSYFSDNSIEAEERRNNAFTALCALRECITIAKQSDSTISYKRALAFLKDINPSVYTDIKNLLTQTNESEIVKYYKQVAESLSNKGEEITPLELIEKEIERNRTLLDGETEGASIWKKIFELEAAREYFLPEQITENRLLNHDFTLEGRDSFFGKKIYNSEKLKDYKLSKDRILRLRFLHPDKAEHILGADLIYEQFNLKAQEVRFVHLQYKTWDDKILYFSNGNLLNQVEKLFTNMCNSGYCYGEHGDNLPEKFRLPYCSSFLRPTSKVNKPDSKLLTSGIHVPICVTKVLANQGNKLTKFNCAQDSVSFKIFEELFINNLIGSRFISFEELEFFYQEKGINSEVARIRVHAQEVIIS